MIINIHIERLILDGVNVPQGQHGLLQAALETELARLLTEGGLSPLLASGGVLHRLPGGEISLSGVSPEPAQLGRQIAQSVYRGIGR